MRGVGKLAHPAIKPRAMPRPQRLDLPDVAQHVIQRGNDRRACFVEDADYCLYRGLVGELSQREGCAVHAYVLMTNHVHLLLTPSAKGAVARLMQALGRRYVRHFNDRHGRTGTLWEGRYKSCLVDAGNHLLQCQRYVELNPLRAAMVADPADYPWSSHRHNAFGSPDPLITPHRTILALGRDVEERRLAYRAWTMARVDPEELDAIRRHIRRQHAYGADPFRATVERLLGRAVGPRRIGRPATAARGKKPDSDPRFDPGFAPESRL